MSGINLYAENIAANLIIPSQTQGFTFNTAINQYQIINNFIPTSLVNSQNALEFINANNAGYRFRQITSDTLTIGNLIIESFTNGAFPGIPLVAFDPEENPITPIIFQGNASLSSFTIGIQTLNATAGFVGIACFDSIGTTQVELGYSPLDSYGIVTTATTNPLVLGANNSVAITILSSNNVGIGTSVPAFTLDVEGTTRTERLLGNAHAPTVSLGAAAGSSPSSTITGSETGGTFSVTTGSSGATSGVIGTFTLNSTMPSSTFAILFTSANLVTGSISKWEAATANNTFTLNAITALSNSTTYKWNYVIIGY